MFVAIVVVVTSLMSVQGYQLTSLSQVKLNAPIKKISTTALQQSTAVLESSEVGVDLKGMSLSGLNGKALIPHDYPSLQEVKAAMPPGTFVKDTWKSLSYTALDVFTTSLTAFLGIKFLLPYAASLLAIPTLATKAAAFAIWAFYSAVVGTCAIGGWVTAHECGHGAFSDNRFLQDFVGYVLHSLMLVPYFSWQRSHAVHHAFTNHMVDGETHVPPLKTNPEKHFGQKNLTKKLFGNYLGDKMFGLYQVLTHLFLGWPAYLVAGATGGPSRGVTNHFVPIQFKRPFQQVDKLKDLFPGSWKLKVLLSDIGVAATAFGLFTLAQKVGWQWVAAAYGGPYLVINAWLVGYTWLQHCEVDIPHLPAEGFNFVKGAFHTVDRPYDKMMWGLIDFLHHHIGSTHVVHHIDSTIPQYRAKAATEAIKKAYPDLYLYEPTPIFQAMWRVASKCFIVEKRKNARNEDIYVFVDN